MIGPGDVQWMTAASGVLHKECHEQSYARSGGPFQMAQLWVNLPQAHKMCAAALPSVATGRAAGQERRAAARAQWSATGRAGRAVWALRDEHGAGDPPGSLGLQPWQVRLLGRLTAKAVIAALSSEGVWCDTAMSCFPRGREQHGSLPLCLLRCATTCTITACGRPGLFWG